MLFNSLHFALFLPIVFILYWFVTNKTLPLQNVLLLVSSYFFYACWDWRFLFLLIFSTLLDYLTALKMKDTKNDSAKKCWLWLSITVNVGFLGIFKYYNFFAASFSEALSHIGLNINPWTVKVILPVGISFYTFHGLSYIIDVYKDKIKAEKNFIDYAVFVSFFPLLVAGPIERATHLLPQIKQHRTFEFSMAVDGLKQILWGLFKKMVIADQCAVYANMVFNNQADYSGSTLALGALFFTFQIYGDFAGYSDIALGTAKLFGIELLRNFAYPYFSRSVAEFWRRWHISLTSWFRDYVYIPLGGSHGSNAIKVRNVLIIFLLSSLWHGANWTFLVWGLLNVLYIIPSIVFKSNRNNLDIVASGKYFPTFKELFWMLFTFALTAFAWIFFRSATITHAFHFVSGIFSVSLFSKPELMPVKIFMLTGFFIIIEWLGREQQYAIANLPAQWPKAVRWGFYYMLVSMILYFQGSNQPFIYFQF